MCIKIIITPNNLLPSKKPNARKVPSQKPKQNQPHQTVQWAADGRVSGSAGCSPSPNVIHLKLLRMKILSAGRSPQPVSRVPEGCQFPACALLEMTQSWYSLSFGKSSCAPGSTKAAATAAIRPGERHLHGCQVCRAPLCQNSLDSAELRVLPVALPKLAFQRGLGGKVSLWENGNFVSWRGKQVLTIGIHWCH